MTVTIKQREPDRHTKEQHVYTIYDVSMITTTRDGYDDYYIRVFTHDGKRKTYSMLLFDLEVHG